MHVHLNHCPHRMLLFFPGWRNGWYRRGGPCRGRRVFYPTARGWVLVQMLFEQDHRGVPDQNCCCFFRDFDCWAYGYVLEKIRGKYGATLGG